MSTSIRVSLALSGFRGSGSSRSVGDGTDDEADGGGGAATEVERAEGAGTLDLVVAGSPADLPGRVDEHADAAGPHRVAAADEPTARVDGQATTQRDGAVLDGLPRLPRTGQPDVVDGEVLGRGEAVVHLEPVEVLEGDVGPVERVGHSPAHVRQDVELVAVTVELLPEPEAHGAVAPSLDARDGSSPRVVAQVGVVEAVPPVVLVGDGAEDVGPHEASALTVVAHPGGRAEVRGRLVAGHGLLELDAEHEGAVVVPCPEVGHGGEQRHPARRA